MKRLGIALAAAALASFAHAADLPTTKAPEKAKPNCWASFWDWLNSSAADCPIGAYGITLYGTLDLNATYLNEGVERSPAADKVNYSIQRNAYESKWLAGYNGLSASVIGLRMKEDLARVGLPGWSLIGVLEAGVNPYSGMFFSGPRSLAYNNARPANTAPFQNTNFDGSRAGQWDNSQGFLGISNPVYGTLTFGRTNSLALSVTSAYDPVASTAFSTLGFSAAFSGFGSSPSVRPNTAFTYRLTYQDFRAAVQAQVGSYGIGNATNGMYQAQLGVDFGSLSRRRRIELGERRGLVVELRRVEHRLPHARQLLHQCEQPVLRPQHGAQGDAVQQSRRRVGRPIQVGSGPGDPLSAVGSMRGR